jgi:hypothetical protein
VRTLKNVKSGFRKWLEDLPCWGSVGALLLKMQV